MSADSVEERARELARDILHYNGSWYNTSDTAEGIIVKKLAAALRDERRKALRDAAEEIEISWSDQGRYSIVGGVVARLRAMATRRAEAECEPSQTEEKKDDHDSSHST